MSLRTRPRLSIVIATRNAAAILEHCLHSIIGQHYGNWELLVADGGSSDGTVELIRRYEDHVAWWESRNDGGIYDAWNTALEHATGEYVCFLGADDAWHDASTLERVFAAIGDDAFDLVTGRGVLVDRAGRGTHLFGNPWDYRKLMRRMTICHPGALHRRDLFRRFGTFDASYRISADYDFLLRLPANLRSLHLDVPLVDVADQGLSRDRRWLMLAERYRAQSSCERIGRTRATLNFLDKLWRIPVAKVLGIPN